MTSHFAILGHFCRFRLPARGHGRGSREHLFWVRALLLIDTFELSERVLGGFPFPLGWVVISQDVNRHERIMHQKNTNGKKNGAPPLSK